MAMLVDSLRILPPELRLCIYSYLLSGDGDDTVRIRHRQNARDGDRFAEDPCAVLALPGDPVYVAHRRNPNRHWPDEVEEVFFQGM